MVGDGDQSVMTKVFSKKKNLVEYEEHCGRNVFWHRADQEFSFWCAKFKNHIHISNGIVEKAAGSINLEFSTDI